MQGLGYLNDPGDHMGMLDMQRMRAARVVFDIGVHLELEVPRALGQQHIDLGGGLLTSSAANLPMSEGRLKFEFTRYLAGRTGPVLQGRPAPLGRIRGRARISPRLRSQGISRTKALNIGSVGLDTLKRALLGLTPKAVEMAVRGSVSPEHCREDRHLAPHRAAGRPATRQSPRRSPE